MYSIYRQIWLIIKQIKSIFTNGEKTIKKNTDLSADYTKEELILGKKRVKHFSKYYLINNIRIKK